jgi:hypothetical protein
MSAGSRAGRFVTTASSAAVSWRPARSGHGRFDAEATDAQARSRKPRRIFRPGLAARYVKAFALPRQNV